MCVRKNLHQKKYEKCNFSNAILQENNKNQKAEAEFFDYEIIIEKKVP